MSTASVDSAADAQMPVGGFPATSRTPVTASELRHWLRLFISELRIVYRRPRNMAMLAVLAAAPIFLGIVLKINTPQPGSGPPDGAGEFIGQVAENGVSLSLLAMFVLMKLVLPLSVAVVSRDSIAGSARLGTLPTLLTVPARRVRLLLTKDLMIGVCVFSARLLVAGVGLLMGAILLPIGPVT